MVNYPPARLDAVFAALADPTRRAVLARLARREAVTSELARDSAMSLPGFMKHLALLERAGLLARRKQGRVVQFALVPQALKDASDWLDRYRRFWEERLDALGRYLDESEPRSRTRPARRKPRVRAGSSSWAGRKGSPGLGRSRGR